jgi:ornithine--oxo-acid transaminase
MGPFLRDLTELCGMDMALLMNSGAEAVETAIKTARKWGYEVKGVAPDRGKVIVAGGNFHGRTITIVSFSTDEASRRNFGPLTPGSRWSRTATRPRSRPRSTRTPWRSWSSRSRVRPAS